VPDVTDISHQKGLEINTALNAPETCWPGEAGSGCQREGAESMNDDFMKWAGLGAAP
jgi:hypothetical protein